jgi:hypothetical protein
MSCLNIKQYRAFILLNASLHRVLDKQKWVLHRLEVEVGDHKRNGINGIIYIFTAYSRAVNRQIRFLNRTRQMLIIVNWDICR